MSEQSEYENQQSETITHEGQLEHSLTELAASKQMIIALSDEEMETVTGGRLMSISFVPGAQLFSAPENVNDVDIIEKAITKVHDLKMVYHIMRISGNSCMQSIRKAVKIVL